MTTKIFRFLNFIFLIVFIFSNIIFNNIPTYAKNLKSSEELTLDFNVSNVGFKSATFSWSYPEDIKFSMGDYLNLIIIDEEVGDNGQVPIFSIAHNMDNINLKSITSFEFKSLSSSTRYNAKIELVKSNGDVYLGEYSFSTSEFTISDMAFVGVSENLTNKKDIRITWNVSDPNIEFEDNDKIQIFMKRLSDNDFSKIPIFETKEKLTRADIELPNFEECYQFKIVYSIGIKKIESEIFSIDALADGVEFSTKDITSSSVKLYWSVKDTKILKSDSKIEIFLKEDSSAEYLNEPILELNGQDVLSQSGEHIVDNLKPGTKYNVKIKFTVEYTKEFGKNYPVVIQDEYEFVTGKFAIKDLSISPLSNNKCTLNWDYDGENISFSKNDNIKIYVKESSSPDFSQQPLTISENLLTTKSSELVFTKFNTKYDIKIVCRIGEKDIIQYITHTVEVPEVDFKIKEIKKQSLKIEATINEKIVFEDGDKIQIFVKKNTEEKYSDTPLKELIKVSDQELFKGNKLEIDILDKQVSTKTGDETSEQENKKYDFKINVIKNGNLFQEKIYNVEFKEDSLQIVNVSFIKKSEKEVDAIVEYAPSDYEFNNKVESLSLLMSKNVDANTGKETNTTEEKLYHTIKQDFKTNNKFTIKFDDFSKYKLKFVYKFKENANKGEQNNSESHNETGSDDKGDKDSQEHNDNTVAFSKKNTRLIDIQNNSNSQQKNNVIKSTPEEGRTDNEHTDSNGTDASEGGSIDTESSDSDESDTSKDQNADSSHNSGQSGTPQGEDSGSDGDSQQSEDSQGDKNHGSNGPQESNPSQGEGTQGSESGGTGNDGNGDQTVTQPNTGNKINDVVREVIFDNKFDVFSFGVLDVQLNDIKLNFDFEKYYTPKLKDKVEIFLKKKEENDFSTDPIVVFEHRIKEVDLSKIDNIDLVGLDSGSNYDFKAKFTPYDQKTFFIEKQVEVVTTPILLKDVTVEHFSDLTGIVRWKLGDNFKFNPNDVLKVFYKRKNENSYPAEPSETIEEINSINSTFIYMDSIDAEYDVKLVFESGKNTFEKELKLNTFVEDLKAEITEVYQTSAYLKWNYPQDYLLTDGESISIFVKESSKSAYGDEPDYFMEQYEEKSEFLRNFKSAMLFDLLPNTNYDVKVFLDLGDIGTKEFEISFKTGDILILDFQITEFKPYEFNVSWNLNSDKIDFNEDYDSLDIYMKTPEESWGKDNLIYSFSKNLNNFKKARFMVDDVTSIYDIKIEYNLVNKKISQTFSTGLFYVDYKEKEYGIIDVFVKYPASIKFKEGDELSIYVAEPKKPKYEQKFSARQSNSTDLNSVRSTTLKDIKQTSSIAAYLKSSSITVFPSEIVYDTRAENSSTLEIVSELVGSEVNIELPSDYELDIKSEVKNSIGGKSYYDKLDDGTDVIIIEDIVPRKVYKETKLITTDIYGKEVELFLEEFKLEPETVLEDFLYNSYYFAFDRSPDEGGYIYWRNKLEENGDVTGRYFLINLMFAEKEFADRNLSDEELIKALYQIVVNRTYDSKGLSYWIAIYKQYLNKFSGDKYEAKKTIVTRMIHEPEFEKLCKKMKIKW